MSSLPDVVNAPMLLVLGVSAVLLGLMLLVMGRWPQGRCKKVLGWCGGFLAGLAIITLLLAHFEPVPMPLVGLAGMFAAPVFLTSARPWGLTAAGLALARDARLHGALLLLVAPMVAVGWSWQVDQEATRAPDRMQFPKDEPIANPKPSRQFIAHTDHGRPLPLFGVADHATRPVDEAAETRLIQDHSLALHLIQVGKPDRATNCHGWVYTGGQYCIDSADVATILQDNGYEAVSTPHVGDLVIYRDSRGQIDHSAVVRVVTEDGQVLLQSKWARLGCFLHAPRDYPLAKEWTYYRSPRAGHLLHDLPEATGSEASPTHLQ